MERIYAGQAKFLLTSGPRSSLTVLPVAGPDEPHDLVKTIELSESPEPTVFQRQLEEIRTRGLGAFLVVDMDTYESFATQVPPADNEGGSDQNTLVGSNTGSPSSDASTQTDSSLGSSVLFPMSL